MNYKTLLIYPKVPDTYWSYTYTLQLTGKKATMPPLGLMTIAALFPENYKLKLVDMNIEDLSEKDVLWADIVFVSAMIVQKESFAEVVTICNNLARKVVAGGPYPTSSYKEIDGVDHFLLNEGEITLPQFLSDFEKGSALPVYADTTKPDITLTPPPRFDLINIPSYGSLSLQNSRGCPFSCEFCDIIEIFGRVPRYKLPAQFIHEMEVIYDTGYRGPLFIVDDNFIGNKQKVKMLLKEIILFQKRMEYPYTFFTEASINLAEDDELLDLMVAAGFDSVFVGLETPDAEILKKTNKLQNLRGDLLTSVARIQAKGIEVMSGFILGFDNEGEDIFERQITFIQKAGIPVAMIGLMLALPATQLYRRLEKEGRILFSSSGNNSMNMELNFIPTMDRVSLIEGYQHVLTELYKPKNYFKRCLTFLSNNKRKTSVVSQIDIPAVLLFLKTIFIQSFSQYGLFYISYLIKALLLHSNKIYFVASLAMRGHHFFIMTREIKKAARISQKMKITVSRFQTKIAVSGFNKEAIVELKTKKVNKLKSLYVREKESVRLHLEYSFKKSLEQIDLLFTRYTESQYSS